MVPQEKLDRDMVGGGEHASFSGPERVRFLADDRQKENPVGRRQSFPDLPPL